MILSMIKRLADALRLRGDIGRLDMLVGLVGVLIAAVLLSVVGSLLLGLIRAEVPAPAIIVLAIGSIGFSLAIQAAIAMLAVARLRRLEWPVWLAMIPVINALWDRPLLFIYWLIAGDFGDIPLLWLLIGTVATASNTILLLVLLTWDGAMAQRLSFRSRAVLLLAAYLLLSVPVTLKGGVYEASLEGFGAPLPTLTAAILPFLPLTPWFLIGAIPAILVTIARRLPDTQAGAALGLSGVILVAYLIWLWFLWTGVVFPVNRMNALV